MRLRKYLKTYEHTRNFLTRSLWVIFDLLLIRSGIAFLTGTQNLLLLFFGARLGRRIIIKPGVKIKYPWNLKIGNDVWLGERVWIDNLDEVMIEDNVCISQGVYLCTGNHDWGKETFDLKLGKIHIREGAWVAAKAVVGPGVTVGKGSVLTLGSVASSSLDDFTIYSGNPARSVKKREIKN